MMVVSRLVPSARLMALSKYSRKRHVVSDMFARQVRARDFRAGSVFDRRNIRGE